MTHEHDRNTPGHVESHQPGQPGVPVPNVKKTGSPPKGGRPELSKSEVSASDELLMEHPLRSHRYFESMLYARAMGYQYKLKRKMMARLQSMIDRGEFHLPQTD